MRVFPGGYKKTKYDLEQDRKATKATLAAKAKFRAEMKSLEQRLADEENEIKLSEAWKKFEAEMAKGTQPKPKKRQRKAAA